MSLHLIVVDGFDPTLNLGRPGGVYVDIGHRIKTADQRRRKFRTLRLGQGQSGLESCCDEGSARGIVPHPRGKHNLGRPACFVPTFSSGMRIAFDPQSVRTLLASSYFSFLLSTRFLWQWGQKNVARCACTVRNTAVWQAGQGWPARSYTRWWFW